MYIIIAAFIICLGFIAISAYLVRLSVYPQTKDHQCTYGNEVESGHFTKAYYEQLNKEKVTIKSPYGYDLHGLWIPGERLNRIVVIVHGYSYTLFGSIKYVSLFHRLGFSVMVYDHRYHGLSGGSNTTFGFKEHVDLKAVYDYLENRFGKDICLGSHGESLGGTTVLLHGAFDHRVKFIISDCAFSDMRRQLAYRLKVEYRLPRFPVIYIASAINRVVTGNFYYQVSPQKVAAKIRVPTMIIHGCDDTYTPYEQGEDLYQALNCPKRFYGAVGAGHAQSLNVNKDKYFEEVKTFLSENHLLECHNKKER